MFSHWFKKEITVPEARLTGDEAEALACKYLTRKGFRILCQNFSVPIGEIDIIAYNREGTLCFIEVKYRHTASHGSAEEFVTPAKQLRITKAAYLYLSQENLDHDRPMRFDVIAMEPGDIRHIPNAFETATHYH